MGARKSPLGVVREIQIYPLLLSPGLPRGCFGERQRGPLGVAEVERIPPGRHREEPLVGLACLLRAAGARADAGSVESPGGWLTTVVSRVCLDALRSRASRREEPLVESPQLPRPRPQRQPGVPTRRW